jgi:hypothetical protein
MTQDPILVHDEENDFKLTTYLNPSWKDQKLEKGKYAKYPDLILFHCQHEWTQVLFFAC